MEQYEIVIVNETSDKNSSNLAGQGEKNDENIAKVDAKVGKALQYAALHSVRTLVVSRVGQYTRDNMLQRRIDTALSLSEDVAAFAINPVFGAINLGIKVASQAIDYNISLEKQYTRNRINLERAGYLNRSRE